MSLERQDNSYWAVYSKGSNSEVVSIINNSAKCIVTISTSVHTCVLLHLPVLESSKEVGETPKEARMEREIMHNGKQHGTAKAHHWQMTWTFQAVQLTIWIGRTRRAWRGISVDFLDSLSPHRLGCLPCCLSWWCWWAQTHLESKQNHVQITLLNWKCV